MNRPLGKSKYLLIGERTRVRSHSRRHYSSEAQLSTAFFTSSGRANQEPDKVERQIFDSPPSHRAVALPAGPNEVADLWAMRHFLRNRLDNFEASFATATGK